MKEQAKESWVLFLDPDEVLTNELKQELSKNMPKLRLFFHTPEKYHLWQMDPAFPLVAGLSSETFQKNAVVWPTEIHNQPKTSGKEHKIELKEELAITHFNYESIDEYVSKAMRYAKSEAYGYMQKKQPMTLPNTITTAVSEVYQQVFAGEGYKDGVHGFILALFQMFYSLLVYFYYLEQVKFKTEVSERNFSKVHQNFLVLCIKSHFFGKNKKDSLSVKEKIIEKFMR